MLIWCFAGYVYLLGLVIVVCWDCFVWVFDCRFCRLWAAQIQLSVVLLLFVILLGGLLVWRGFVGLLVDAGWFVYLFICCCFWFGF